MVSRLNAWIVIINKPIFPINYRMFLLDFPYTNLGIRAECLTNAVNTKMCVKMACFKLASFQTVNFMLVKRLSNINNSSLFNKPGIGSLSKKKIERQQFVHNLWKVLIKKK